MIFEYIKANVKIKWKVPWEQVSSFTKICGKTLSPSPFNILCERAWWEGWGEGLFALPTTVIILYQGFLFGYNVTAPIFYCLTFLETKFKTGFMLGTSCKLAGFSWAGSDPASSGPLGCLQPLQGKKQKTGGALLLGTKVLFYSLVGVTLGSR